MHNTLTTWWRRWRYRRRAADFGALFEALDSCRCTGHRTYVEHLALRYGMGPFDAAVECITNVGNMVQAKGLAAPDVSEGAPEPEAVAPIDLANMTPEDEERVFYALLANRYDRLLTDLAVRLFKDGHGTGYECKALADWAVTRWCTPIEDDLDIDALAELVAETKGQHAEG